MSEEETMDPEDLYCGSPLLASYGYDNDYAIACDLLDGHDGPHAWRDNALPNKQGEVVVWWSGGREQDRALPDFDAAIDAAAAEVYAFAEAHGCVG
jgi:hypothetical protein